MKTDQEECCHGRNVAHVVKINYKQWATRRHRHRVISHQCVSEARMSGSIVRTASKSRPPERNASSAQVNALKANADGCLQNAKPIADHQRHRNEISIKTIPRMAGNKMQPTRIRHKIAHSQRCTTADFYSTRDNIIV